MTFRPIWFGACTCLLGSLILTGCARGSSARTKAMAAAQADRPSSKAEEEKRIRTLAHYATGLSYDLNDQSELALEEMLRAAQIDPSSEPVVIEAARRCLRAQKTDKALELLTKATALPQASGSLYAWLGLAYAQAGKTELAISANRTAIKKMPQSLVPYQNLAQVYLQGSRTNDALRVLDQAAQQPTDDPGFLVDLAELYQRYSQGRSTQTKAINERVEKLLDRAADLGVSNPMQMLRVADTYFALGELKKAEPFYRELIEEHPDLANLRGKLTEIYLRSGQKEKASEQLEALAQNEPTNPQAYVFLGALAADEQKYAVAAEHFERALKLDPNLEQVYYDLAGLKLTLKKPQEALAVLAQARARFKISFPMEFYAGIAHGALKQFSEALNAMTSAEAIAKATEPSRLTHLFYFQVGSTYERAGRLPEAEQYFQLCLKLEPDDAEALNYLGYMWAEHGVKLEEARTLIEKAVKLQPDNPAFLDSLAWVFYKLNQPKNALGPMLKSIEHSEEPDATLYDHLGDIYTALHERAQAREAWGKALKLEPNPQIQEKLDALAPPLPSAH